MSYTWILIALVLAALDWIAVARRAKPLEYAAKPGVMLALLLWLAANGGLQGALLWFALGILFSLAGDVFLMLPRVRFIPGLVAFLLAHLAYTAGFTPDLPPLNLPALIVALLIAGVAGSVYPRIAAGLERSGRAGLKTPVFLYTVVISLMLLAALYTLIRPEWGPLPALAASAGALLFYLSDTLLAWNRFVAPLRFGKLPEIIAYHTGQILLVLGAGLHYLQ